MNISVIIPVYNSEDSIRNSVCSVLSQEYKDVEIILVDDGSTDSSALLCDELAASSESVKVIHKKNGGVSSARNAGLDAAQGFYVMFLDSDDVLSPDAFSKMMDYQADMIMGGFEKVVDGSVTEVHVPAAKEVYEGTSGISRFLDADITRKDCFLLNSSCFKLYRRSIIEDNGLRFDEGLSYGEDKIFVFGFLRFTESIATVPEVIYNYLIQKESLSTDVVSDRHLEQIFRLLAVYCPLLEELHPRYPESVRLRDLYHVDVVSRYVFRILTCFALRPSRLLTEENLSLLYSYISADKSLRLFGVRPGQVPNVLLYRIGSERFTKAFYSFTSSISRYISLR